MSLDGPDGWRQWFRRSPVCLYCLVAPCSEGKQLAFGTGDEDWCLGDGWK